MRNNCNTGLAAIIVITVLMFAFAIGIDINKAYVRRDITATVTDKGVKKYEDDDKYLVYCKDKSGKTQVFEITDSVLAMRFDSSNLYAEIKVGQKYIFEVGGFRIPILSWYPNIYSAKEVS